jgi:hypothetical protein
LKLPLEGGSRRLWLMGAAVAVFAAGILVATVVLRSGPAEVALDVPSCSDPGYLRDVQAMVAFNGLSGVRPVGELSADRAQRHCSLAANDASGREVRLRGSIVKVGADLQLSVRLE